MTANFTLYQHFDHRTKTERLARTCTGFTRTGTVRLICFLTLTATVDKEKEKTRQYGQQCESIQADFVPFIIETHGGIGKQANKFIQSLMLALSKHHSPSMTCGEFMNDI